MIMADRETSDYAIKGRFKDRGGEALRAASRQPASTFPITIAEWPRNGDEIVRVRINRFNNSFTVDIRCWVREGNAAFKPTRNGVTLGVKHLTKLDDAIAQGCDRAELWRLLPAINSHDGRATKR